MTGKIPPMILMIVAMLAVSAAVVCRAQQEQGRQRGLEVLYREFPRIEPPSEFPPHPRLFMDQQEIDALLAAARRDAALGELVDDFVAEMLQAADSPQLPTDNRAENNEIARQANRFALAYVLSGEPGLAAAAAAILRGYVEVFPSYTPAHLKGLATSSALEEGPWAVHACAAYDLIYNSGVLSEADQQAIEDVFRASAEVLRHCNHAYRSNWRIRAAAGVGVMGFCIGDRELINEALNGVRDETGMLVRDGFVQQMHWSILADGIYYERSHSYSEECGDSFAWLMEAARHSGMDLWRVELGGLDYDAGADVDRRFGQTGPRTIQPYFDALLYRTFGDGTLAKTANSYWNDLRPRDFWAAAWRIYGDPKYAWPLTLDDGEWLRGGLSLMWLPPRLPEGRFDLSADATVGLTGRHVNACTLLPNGGYTILRQSGDRDAAGVAITWGDYANAHCQADQLTIVVYAAGRQMLPETKYFRYIDQHLTWSKQTISHNTVTVDEVSQYPQGDSDDMWLGDTEEQPARGRAVFFHAGEQLRAFRGACDTAYEGVVLDRTVALVDSIIVDFFRCRSADEHQYDYALHVDGQLADCSAPLGEMQDEPLAESYGYRHIVEVRRAGVDDQAVELAHNADDGTGPQLHLSFLPAGDAELIVGNGIEGLEQERCEVVVLRKTGGDVDFVSVVDPAGDADNRLAVRAIENLPDGVLGVEIARLDGSKDIVLSAETSRTFQYAGQTITGQLSLLHITPDGAAELIDTVE